MVRCPSTCQQMYMLRSDSSTCHFYDCYTFHSFMRPPSEERSQAGGADKWVGKSWKDGDNLQRKVRAGSGRWRGGSDAGENAVSKHTHNTRVPRERADPYWDNLFNSTS